MITGEGAVHIKRFCAGLVPNIAQSIAFGIGNTSPASLDERLQFEVGRADVILTTFDFNTSRLIFRAEIPDTYDGLINEIALYSTPANAVAGEFGAKVLSTFSSDTEEWVDSTTGVAGIYAAGGSRIGDDSLRHTPAPGTSKTDIMNQASFDLSGYSGADKFIFAYNVANANTSNIQFRFMNNAANYYTVSLGAQTAGYKIVEAAKSTAVATGSPNWEGITELRVTTTSVAGGASSVDFDGIRIEDVDTINPNYVMVARDVLSTPFLKEPNKVQEVEFSLEINI